MQARPGPRCTSRRIPPRPLFSQGSNETPAQEVRSVLISEIIPYGRNARHNEKAIPAVAESIKEFGLRGTIGLE